MKSEVYNALASLNRGFDMTLESLKVLQDEGVVTVEYVQNQSVLAEELRAGINQVILNRLETREREDRDHFGKMRASNEAEIKSA